MAQLTIGIVGASLAGVNAATELRRSGFEGRIIVVGDESHPPYDRPPLSKEFLRGARSVEEIGLRLGGATDVEWRLGQAAVSLDAEALTVTMADGSSERFDGGIVIATGARARQIQSSGVTGVHVVRSLDDAGALAAELKGGARDVLVVGAGFIGLEVASSCRELGCRVTVLEALQTPLERVLGSQMGARVGALHSAEGVDLRLGTSIVSMHPGADGRVARVALSDGTETATDLVVVGIGVEHCVEWLDGSGLLTDRGVLTDETCLAAPSVVAAGDVARWPSRRYDELRTVEHWDNAVRQGAHAARRLVAGRDGGDLVFDPIPWFWSDQYTHKMQLLGSTDGFDEVEVIDEDPATGRLLALYRRGDRAVAAFGIGRARQIVECRKLFGGPASWDHAVRTMRGAVPA